MSFLCINNDCYANLINGGGVRPLPSSGIGGIRTRVQTPIEEVFYMLIPIINCRRITGNEQTNYKLSWIVLCSNHSLVLQHLAFFVESAAELGSENTCSGGPNDYIITDYAAMAY
ncbi:hypothetical protein D3C71_168550 [compost metagenome]